MSTNSGQVHINVYAPGDALENGDVFELTEEDADGNAVLRDARELAYSKNFPNGRDCAPSCLQSKFEL